ncbi:MAG TPA: response regulator transcription factor [Chloroflexi bacterium]|nr:response regulator transcription factor [Chloroflexota bacterium]
MDKFWAEPWISGFRGRIPVNAFRGSGVSSPSVKLEKGALIARVESTSSIRVLLADDHSLFRGGVANVLNSQADFEVIGEAGDGLEVLVKARELRPDLVLMDIRMAGCDGLEATRRIKQELPDVTIMMLAVRDEDERLFQAIKSGAQGYLLKSIRSWNLVELLRGAMHGEVTITPALARWMLDEFHSLNQQPHKVTDNGETDITTREKSVLSLVAGGATNQQVVEELRISEQTVKSHLRDILTKLQRGRCHEAAPYTMREGMIIPPSSASSRSKLERPSPQNQ